MKSIFERNRFKKTFLSLLGFSTLVLSFQNCGGGGVAFQSTPQASSVTDPVVAQTCATPKVSVSDTCVCPAGTNDNGVSCISCPSGQSFDAATLTCSSPTPVCNPGSVYDGHACVAISATCNSYVEITNDTFVVPARDIAKTCYYIKLVNASSDHPTKFLDYVLSRNHDSGPVNRAPGIIGQRNLSFLMQAEREVVLSGDTHGGMDISVDNYILIEAMFAGLSTENLWASGTGDVPPLNVAGQSMPIQVHGQPVINFYPYQATGTATFHAIDLSPVLTTQKTMNFIASALDCGGGVSSSDAYLLFR